MKYKISQHLLILYSLTEPSDPIGYSLNFYLRKKRSLLPDFFLTTRMGFEPTTSAVTGRRSNQLSHQAIL